MTIKKLFFIFIILALLLTATGCGNGSTAVYVQSVAELSQMGSIAPGDRFPGIVVSEDVTEIEKDTTKSVAELFVKEGQDVAAGDKLFSYDMEQLQLSVDKLRLEKEQLEATIENYKQQITQLEKDAEKAKGTTKLQYTIQIQTMQLDLKEAELNLKEKVKEVTQSESILNNTTVFAPVSGRITGIHEDELDTYGNPLPFITIQQSGSYRVKGTLSELQRGGIMEGSRIRIVSRTDDSQFWLGTVSLVDYESPTQENPNNMYYGSNADTMTTSSKYPFYVELDSNAGLLLGQHVYLELDMGDEDQTRNLTISTAFLCYEEDGTCYVWAEKKGKLEKRTVTTGEFNSLFGGIEILDGLTEDDYIAFPNEELCAEGVPTTRTELADAGAEGGVE